MGGSEPGATVETLTQALFWYEVVRRGDDGKLITVAQACEHAGISSNSFYSHKRRQTAKWRRAVAQIEALVGHEELRTEARLRAMELLRHGSDTAAGSLIARLLDSGDKREAEADDGPVHIVLEQFGEDDHGGGNRGRRRDRGAAGDQSAGRRSA